MPFTLLPHRFCMCMRIKLIFVLSFIATANDITQIASDWELLHQMLKDNLSPDPEKPMVGQVVKFFEDCWEYSHRKKLENHSAEEEIVMRSVTDLEIGMESVDIGGGDDEDDSQEATREHDSPFPGIPLHTEGSPVLGRRYSDSRSSAENPSKTDNDSIRKDNRETDRGRAAEATQTFEKGLQDLMESCLSAQRDRVTLFLLFAHCMHIWTLANTFKYAMHSIPIQLH